MPTATKPAKPKPVKYPVQSVPLKDIRIDGGTQTRVQINESVVAEYAEDMQAGQKFDPAIIYDDGDAKWLADGFHRYHAKGRAGQKTLLCEIRPGTRRDAWLHSLGANDKHGLRRTNADKRKAVDGALADAELRRKVDSEIARICAVSQAFVSNVRRTSLKTVLSENGSQEREYTDKHGNVSTMNTANIGAQNGSQSGSSLTTVVSEDGTGDDSDSDNPVDDGDNSPATAPAVTQAVGRGTRAPAREPVGQVVGNGEVALYQDHPDLKEEDPFEEEDEASTTAPTKTEDDLEDDEWLATLPLATMLSPDALAIFKADALGWRTLKQSVLGSFKHKVDSAVKFGRTLTPTRGPMLDVMHEAAHVPHPRDWQRCPACRGSRQVWMGKQTHKHEAPGTEKADGSNQLELRCTLVACVACKGGYTLS